MTERSSAPAETEELVFERVFEAPRELVWKAWTDAKAMARWWGPKGYTVPYCQIDARPGGRLHLCMRSPEGRDVWLIGEYREVVEPERIVCTQGPSDEDGNVMSVSGPGMDGEALPATLITVTLEDLGGRTRMTLRHAGLPCGDPSAYARVGWDQCLDRLGDYLSEL